MQKVLMNLLTDYDSFVSGSNGRGGSQERCSVCETEVVHVAIF